ncbi:MAG TPA: neutral zinc metallopeptidase [Patescibacteria group bacterium]|nr:neutral zinc metallopeptidase [Patescibacteria group bacterium]
MADWSKISSRGNVQDRRSMSPLFVGGGGLGVLGLVLYIVINLLGGGDITDVVAQLPNLQVQSQAINTENLEKPDNYNVFASTVLGSANDMWKQVFAQNNKVYTAPTLVLFRTATQGSCGISTSEVGPHYCPLDKSIYLDETFFDELQRRFGAQGGDVAEAYVIAHEVGHHAQNELGILNAVHEEGSSEASIKAELQADCFAGLWANSIKDKGVFESGEIQEALDAAAAVGDDRIQRATEGMVNPETWTHGSSEERMFWFNRGYETGRVAECDTFN